jgi:hypothetical protein
MYFTREALEQASAHAVASYRSQRFHGYPLLADLGCSIGGDTLALAAVAPTLGLDLDPLRLAMARLNLHALDHGDRAVFVQADLAAPLPFFKRSGRLLPGASGAAAPPSAALFFDPARRLAGRRIFSVRDYRPPLETVRSWLPGFPALGVKISPGVDLTELDGYDAEVEFISLRGELKEAVLWFGPLRTAGRRATVLPGPHTLAEIPQPPLPLSAPLAYFYEPDPSVLRAGLVANLGAQLDAFQLDPEIAYLTSNRRTRTPFARVWTVEDWFPFGLKRLRAYLRERGVGRLVIKKRGSPLEPDALIHDLRLAGEQERVVFLTLLRGKPVIVVCFADEQVD